MSSLGGVDQQFQYIFGFTAAEDLARSDQIQLEADDFFKIFKDVVISSELLSGADFASFKEILLTSPDPALLTKDMVNLTGHEASVAVEQMLIDLAKAEGLNPKEVNLVKLALTQPSLVDTRYQLLAGVIVDGLSLLPNMSEDPAALAKIIDNIVGSISNNAPTYLQEKVAAYLAGVKTDDPELGQLAMEVKQMAYFVQNITTAANRPVDKEVSLQRTASTYYLSGEYGAEVFSAMDSVNEKVTNQEAKMAMGDYLAVIAHYTLQYRNVLYRILSEDGRLTLDLDHSRMVMQADKMRAQEVGMERAREKQKAERKKAEKARRQQKAAGIGMIIAGIILLVVVAVLFLIPEPVITKTVAVMGAVTAVSLIVSGANMVAMAKDKQYATTVAKGMSKLSQGDTNAVIIASIVMACMIAAMAFGAFGMAGGVVAAGSGSFMTATGSATASLGAASLTAVPATASTAAYAAFAIGTVGSSIWTPIFATTVTNAMIAYYKSKGVENPEAKAAQSSLIVMSILTAAMILVTVGAGFAARMSNTVPQAAAGAAKVLSSAGGGGGGGTAAAGGASAGAGSGGAAAAGASTVGTATTQAARTASQIASDTVDELVKALAATPRGLVTNFGAAAQIIQASTGAAIAFNQAEVLRIQADIAKIKAANEGHMMVMAAAIEALQSCAQSLIQGDAQIPAAVTSVSEIFQNLVADLEKTLTAVTSGQANAHPAQSSGSISEAKKTTESKENTEMAVQAAAGLLAQSMGTNTQEGIESTKASLNETPKPADTKRAAILSVLATIAHKMASMLRALNPGMSAKQAAQMGMFYATTTLQALVQAQQRGVPLPRDLEKAVQQNPLLVTMAALFSKSIKNKENPQLQDLMENSDFAELMEAGDDASIAKLQEIVNQMAENNPEMKELALLLNSMRSGQDSPLGFSFKALQAMTMAMSIGDKEAIGDDPAESSDAADLLGSILGDNAQSAFEMLKGDGADALTEFGKLLGPDEFVSSPRPATDFQYVRG